MPTYVRSFRPGGTFFLTLVTESRAPIFASEAARSLLHAAFDRCRTFHPFATDAIVCLPDHLHILITLPESDSDFSIRVRSIKYAFTRAYLAAGGAEQHCSASRQRQRVRGVWLKRFWEHTIRDEEDMAQHMDYIVYNPVKHGLARCPHAWPCSSFQRLVRQGLYAPDWRCQCEQTVHPRMDWDDAAHGAGE